MCCLPSRNGMENTLKKKIFIRTRDAFLNSYSVTPHMLSGLNVAQRILTGYVRPQNWIGYLIFHGRGKLPAAVYSFLISVLKRKRGLSQDQRGVAPKFPAVCAHPPSCLPAPGPAALPGLCQSTPSAGQPRASFPRPVARCGCSAISSPGKPCGRPTWQGATSLLIPKHVGMVGPLWFLSFLHLTYHSLHTLQI